MTTSISSRDSVSPHRHLASAAAAARGLLVASLCLTLVGGFIAAVLGGPGARGGLERPACATSLLRAQRPA